MDCLKSFGLAVREHRRLLGISQEELAHRAQLDRTYVSGIERGRRNPTLRIMERLAEALGIGLDRLVATAVEIGDFDEKHARPGSTASRETLPAKRWLSLAEAAAALACRPETVRSLVKRGALAGQKVVSAWQVDGQSLRAYLDARQRREHAEPVSARPHDLELETWLSVQEAAALTGYHVDTLRGLIHAERIAARKSARDWQIDRESLMAYLRFQEARGKRRGPKPRQGRGGVV